MSAPREEPDHRCPIVDPEGAARRLTSRRRLQLVEERMADELHGHSGPAIQGRLERKYGEHERDDSPDRLDPAPAPRPDLGRDEIHDRDAGAPRGACQAKIELGEIDQDEHGGAGGAPGPVAEAAAPPVEAPRPAHPPPPPP